MPAGDVYALAGGNAYELYKENPTGYANACALRLSRAFNYGGLTITASATGYKVKGGDGKNYLLRVTDMIAFVKANFGAPDTSVEPNGRDVSTRFSGKTGILIFDVSGWGNATGHVTLWNGADCGDHCYFIHDQPSVETTKILFWELR
ncbi:MAG: type VI secretion system amidase effector protein Tae4 [Lysobacter sp.]